MKSNDTTNKGIFYRRFGVVTVFAVFFLILVGGIVRSTGSGMGCPDWPLCFGQYIPPTDISQLPDDYKTIYAVAGKEIADFSAFKTWVEYVNRLVGVAIGLLVFFTLVFSFSYLKKDPQVTVFSFIAFVLVGVEGWLGSKVVATDLNPFMITLHMLLALVIVGVLIYAVARSKKQELSYSDPHNLKKVNKWLMIILSMSVFQIIMGTQVRESIDEIAIAMGEAQRHLWIDQLDEAFYFHRSFSIVVGILNIIFIKNVFIGTEEKHPARFWSLVLFGLLTTVVLSGAIMGHFGIPAFLQPIHLLLGSLIVGCQFYIALLVNHSRILGNVRKVEEKHSKNAIA
ncbi:COX15/CtaA family protein [Flammeovirga yaeyamensis]|uniref:COX15/CtaA family protein n=1 Tax=Flammeovirga yaeyamensis TaxID=367791 RepID=A0AAX1N8I0_9BACT|nr:MULTISPECIES: COX15/CtaA family protein [Flammeovirga]ANQ48660.1 heme A synthase [Flammeovirga sp. MY04]MBB3698741.1 cytochrome c oxidase assembly protein subunit 15 [Flammeovirga yaeyamensis]NMF37327.1 heme A synthase [Flammeovirga yaeyamensis]QWG03855.1 COX15/CtaA family protein [Flammeovirga yaeyamensis]